MKRVAILVEQMYQDLEVWYPYYRLLEAGHKPEFVGSGSSKSYTGKYGYPLSVDRDVKTAKGYDCVIIPGGFAPDFMRRHPATVEFIRREYKNGAVVAAICHGAWMLASAGIIKNKTVTCFYAIRDDVVNAGAKYIDKEVVVSGNIITSRNPDDLPHFMREILKKLED